MKSLDTTLAVNDSGQMQVILDHLRTGCVRCAETVQLLECLAASGHLPSSGQEPPEYSVESVKEVFANAARRETGLHQDSGCWSIRSDDPTPAAGSAGRPLTFEGSDHLITFRLDRDRTAGKVRLAGEILHCEHGPVVGVPTCLLLGYRVVAYSVTRDLGDFSFVFAPTAGARLRVLLARERFMEIDLDAESGSGKIFEGPMKPVSDGNRGENLRSGYIKPRLSEPW